ncbi:MAG: EscU/YscU/HrcU family type III secretion system export apparatus switch protein [Pseudomonadota bacterium]
MSHHSYTDDLPPSRSAALAYSGSGAPKLVAKGDEAFAARIIEIAQQHDVPIVQDGQLTEILSLLEVGDEIPPSLYIAIAEVLAYVYRLNESFDERV